MEREALQRRQDAEADIYSSVEASGSSRATYVAAMERLRSDGRVALAFHPERVTRSSGTVVDGLLSDGVYRNQFETNLSGGSNSAYAGGRRDEWERRLFGGAYHANGVDFGQRPKYGALYLVAHPDGPCPRFGSSYLVLRPEVSRRCSFTLLGSQEDGARLQAGTLDVLEPVMAALAHHIGNTPAPLGVDGLTFGDLLAGLASDAPMVRQGVPPDRAGRALDTFVEAQVHGTIDLKRDVEAVVVDASLRGTATEGSLVELSSRYGIALRWHAGFELQADEFPASFRGFPARALAERVARRGVVDAAALGAGSNAFTVSPESWDDLGSPSAVRTSLRRVWHVLVLSGRPSPYWRDVPPDQRAAVNSSRGEGGDG